MSDSSTASSKPRSQRKPINRSQQSLRRPTREAYSKRTIEFDSSGESCVGDLYLPDRPEKPPVVVMAPGLGLWRTFGLPAVAERFAEAGYAAFLFDFRHLGDSTGQPRGLVSPTKQIADYEAAIDAMRETDSVDTNRLVVWGHSLSGGHALSVGAATPRVAGVIALNPFVDGRQALKTGLQTPKRTLKALAAGLKDRVGHRVGAGRTVRIVAAEDELGVISQPGAKRGLFDLVDRHADWENSVPARVLLALPRYRPITTLKEIRSPTLVVGGRNDRITPAAGAAAAADTITDATYLELPMDHLGAFTDAFETTVDHQLAFLRSTVGHR